MFLLLEQYYGSHCNICPLFTKRGQGKGGRWDFSQSFFFSPATIVAFIISGPPEIPPAQVVTLIFPSRRVKQVERKPSY